MIEPLVRGIIESDTIEFGKSKITKILKKLGNKRLVEIESKGLWKKYGKQVS